MMAQPLVGHREGNEEQLAAFMREMLEREPRLFGTCVVLEHQVPAAAWTLVVVIPEQ